MNNKGKGSGLLLLVILIVALLVAWFAVKNLGSLSPGKGTASQQEAYVQQAQGLVDQINGRLQQAGVEP